MAYGTDADSHSVLKLTQKAKKPENNRDSHVESDDES